jgi:hypothetical protein
MLLKGRLKLIFFCLEKPVHYTMREEDIDEQKKQDDGSVMVEISAYPQGEHRVKNGIR